MKKLLLLLIAFPLMSMQCEAEDSNEQCTCKIKGTRYISYNEGETWTYSSTDERTGEYFPCYYDGVETEQTYGNVFWHKTVWTCND